jgi:hypothetical protein
MNFHVGLLHQETALERDRGVEDGTARGISKVLERGR